MGHTTSTETAYPCVSDDFPNIRHWNTETLEHRWGSQQSEICFYFKRMQRITYTAFYIALCLWNCLLSVIKSVSVRGVYSSYRHSHVYQWILKKLETKFPQRENILKAVVNILGQISWWTFIRIAFKHYYLIWKSQLGCGTKQLNLPSK